MITTAVFYFIMKNLFTKVSIFIILSGDAFANSTSLYRNLRKKLNNKQMRSTLCFTKVCLWR